MIQYNSEPKRLQSVFFRYRNDIDIYTEDEDKDKEFYKLLFKRLLNSSIKINDITPLGSKKDVIDRCNNDPKDERKKIYIVDGDIQLLNNSNPIINNLFILDRYCIENYLIDKKSVVDYIYYKCGTSSKDRIEEDLSFSTWISFYKDKLMKLFIHFAIKDSYEGRFELFNAYKYHHKDKIKNEYEINFILLDEDICKLKKEIIEDKGEEFYKYELKKYFDTYKFNEENFLKFVSGKDYLIPLLQIKCTSFKKTKDKDHLEAVKINLVEKFDISSLSNLKTAIESL